MKDAWREGRGSWITILFSLKIRLLWMRITCKQCYFIYMQVWVADCGIADYRWIEISFIRRPLTI